jgi:hypothetical protein
MTVLQCLLENGGADASGSAQNKEIHRFVPIGQSMIY